jgi:hypothetical protein
VKPEKYTLLGSVWREGQWGALKEAPVAQ